MNRDIKRSKSLRTWHKYKNLVFVMIAVLIVVIAIVIGVVKAVGNKAGTKDETSSETVTETESVTEMPSTEPETTTEAPSTEPETTTAATDIVKTPVEEEFTNEAAFEGAVFVGDAFVEGIELYQFLESKQLVYDRNWTTGKAESNGLDKIAATNANKVFFEIGINDLNNGKSPESVYESYKEFVDAVKTKLPSAEIYVVSLLPVTSGFEAKENVSIDNDNVAKLNELLSTMEGVTFLDVNKSVADGSGNLPDEMSSSGLNVKKGYYGFILNLIAEMIQ